MKGFREVVQCILPVAIPTTGETLHPEGDHGFHLKQRSILSINKSMEQRTMVHA